MHRLLLPLVLALGVLPGALRAQAPAELDRLIEALGLPEVIAIMREEGILYADALEAELFSVDGGSRWDALVEKVYDPVTMLGEIESGMAGELGSADIAPMLSFFEDARGQRIIELEITARRALLDDEIEQASLDALDQLVLDQDPFLDQLQEFVEANQLVDSNVVGALNSNIAFYRGMADGGAYPGGLDEGEMLSMVWGQEPAIRDDTEAWVYSYLAMAYAPLSEEDLGDYIRFSRTDAGGALNAALFAAFDEMFVRISYDLGVAAARFVGGEEL
jgi:hypothetical protein